MAVSSISCKIKYLRRKLHGALYQRHINDTKQFSHHWNPQKTRFEIFEAITPIAL